MVRDCAETKSKVDKQKEGQSGREGQREGRLLSQDSDVLYDSTFILL